ncbi:MAG: hypothetical protein LDL56_12330 [Armatimonadetes bacterium]|nr:hypothetical protein [Armatimonadota bacterium]
MHYVRDQAVVYELARLGLTRTAIGPGGVSTWTAPNGRVLVVPDPTEVTGKGEWMYTAKAADVILRKARAVLAAPPLRIPAAPPAATHHVDSALIRP